MKRAGLSHHGIAGGARHHDGRRGVHQLTADRSGKEVVLHLSLGALEWEEAPGLGPQRVPLLLVGYARGFQAWSLEDAHALRELVSRRVWGLALLRLQGGGALGAGGPAGGGH